MTILTSRAYRKAMQEGGESHSFIRVRNLSTQALVGGDQWGVPTGTIYRRNKLQPIFLSAALSLRQPFDSAASADKLNRSTVNYSTLSKEILKVVASRRPDIPHREGFVGIQRDWALCELLCWIYMYLTGRWPYGPPPIASVARDFLDGGCPCLEDEYGPAYRPPLLDVSQLIELELSVFLPKATLMSSGVSLTAALGYYEGLEERSNPFRSVLKLHDLRIPTLVGVNINERAAKQIVVVNVELDPYLHRAQDFYNELEQIVVKTVEESSFETLESLATHLSKRVIKYFIYPYSPGQEIFSQVRICLEKPSAIMFADAPAIEIIRSSDPSLDVESKKLYEEWFQNDDEHGVGAFRPGIPFPLQGRLDAWIEEMCPEDTTGCPLGAVSGQDSIRIMKENWDLPIRGVVSYRYKWKGKQREPRANMEEMATYVINRLDWPYNSLRNRSKPPSKRQRYY